MKYTIENTTEVGKPMRVFLDGVEVKCAIECDTLEGYVLAYELDDEDCVIDGCATIRYGEVTVEPIEV